MSIALDIGIQGVALVSANPAGDGVAVVARQTGSVVSVVRNSIGDFTMTTDPLSILDYAPLGWALVDLDGSADVKGVQLTETTWSIKTTAGGALADIDFFVVLVRYPSSSGVFTPTPAPTPASLVTNGSLWARHVFGTGALGDVTVVADNPAFLGGDFDNFTLDPGWTISPPAGRGIMIRARQAITINGTIDCSGANLAGSVADIADQGLLFGSSIHVGGAGGGASGDAVAGQTAGPVQDSIAALGFTGTINGIPGVGGGGAGGAGGNSTSPVIGTEAIGLVRFWPDNGVPLPFSLGGLFGGEGGDGGDGGTALTGALGGSGGLGGAGGGGGSYIALIAPTIHFGAAAEVLANGLPGHDGTDGAGGADGAAPGDNGGGGGGGGGGGQGGTGGYVYFLYVTKTDLGATIEANGGIGGINGLAGAGGLGNGGGVSGGAGGNVHSPGVGGTRGRDGYVIDRQLTPMP